MSDNLIMESTSRQVDWERYTKYKAMSKDLSELYRLADLGDERADAVFSCAERLNFAVSEEGSRYLASAYFCQERLCPMCAWRRSRKIFGQVIRVVSDPEASRFEYIMLTLTIKNALPDELNDTITRMMRGFSNLTKLKPWRGVVEGYFRAFELTYNPERGDYHPHFHVICAVQPGYFAGKNYLRHSKWVSIWKSAMDLEYEPSVEVHRVRELRGEGKAGAVAEVAKYAVKVEDILALDTDVGVEVVRAAWSALFRRKLIGWGGALRKIHIRLGLDDAIAGDLTEKFDMASDKAVAVAYEVYRWRPGFYQLMLIEPAPDKPSAAGEDA